MSNKQRKLYDFFNKKASIESEDQHQQSKSDQDARIEGEVQKCDRTSQAPTSSASIRKDYFIVRDPGERDPIWKVPVNERDEVRRAYLEAGPYQLKLDNYPVENQRRFQYHWFSEFPWLEYSPKVDVVYCLPCFLFTDSSKAQQGWDAFTVKGFRKWKKVKDGKNCSFKKHIGIGPCSPHNNAVHNCHMLLKQSSHIDKVIEKQSNEEVEKNRLRVRTSIDVARFLSFQGIAFRGNDESVDSRNRGNFIELLKFLATYSDDVERVILEKPPHNAKYTSPMIQKEILHVFAKKVRNKICEHINDSKFCIIVDEACDESRKEQMALVLRFVDITGFIQERFFHISHVKDTSSITLYSEICDILSRYGLNVKNIRGQGYDGASNMRGEWNGLQALFLKDCQQAYYVHCCAHRLQLALVAAAREVDVIHEFFLNVSLIVNTINASAKRHDQLQEVHFRNITHLVAEDEIETGTGANQIGTLKRPCDTRWSSHLAPISSLLNMFDAVAEVLSNIRKEGNSKTKCDAAAALRRMTSFEFVFIAHLMYETFGITEVLCLALQEKNQDIVKAMDLVATTSLLLQRLRMEGWDSFFQKVGSFCSDHKIRIPDFSAPHFLGQYSRRHDGVSEGHYYQFDIFNAAIDFQMQEISSRFNDRIVELLKLSSSLNPKHGFASFNIESICNLARNYYPQDFTNHDLELLPFQLQHFHIEVRGQSYFEGLSSIGELCQVLAATGKSTYYFLVDRLIRLVLTLPVSTATTERAFSAMKILKNRLRNKMHNDFLADSMQLYIERSLAETFDLDSLVDDFRNLKERRVEF